MSRAAQFTSMRFPVVAALRYGYYRQSATPVRRTLSCGSRNRSASTSPPCFCCSLRWSSSSDRSAFGGCPISTCCRRMSPKSGCRRRARSAISTIIRRIFALSRAANCCRRTPPKLPPPKSKWRTSIGPSPNPSASSSASATTRRKTTLYGHFKARWNEYREHRQPDAGTVAQRSQRRRAADLRQLVAHGLQRGQRHARPAHRPGRR